MRTCTALFSVLVLSAAAPVLAQQPSSVTSLEGARPPPGAHRHDGFYLRFGTGFGGYTEAINEENADQSTRITGLASMSELAIGGAIRPGLIFGGGFWSCSVLSSDRTIDGVMLPDEVMGGSGNFTLVGPFLDWYFRARGGLHLQFALGVAAVRGGDMLAASDNPDAVSVGGGAMIGFGYEWWASDEWSVGILARAVGVGAVQQDDAGRTWVHGIGASPSILFTATFN